MKVLCLTKYPSQGPSSRYRVYQFLPYLERAGIEIEIQTLHNDDYLTRMFAGGRPSPVYLAGRVLRRTARLLSARRFDLVFVQKEIFPHVPDLAEVLLHAANVKVVVDIDDAIHLLYDQSRSTMERRLLGEKLPRVLRRASLVLAGNTYLETYAKRYARRVEFFPTVVDASRFRPVEPRVTSGVPVLGWIGSPATVSHLIALVPALERLARTDEFELRIVGAPSIHADGVNVSSRPWREADEMRELAGFDIGLMPLEATAWAEGKCALKLLQYLSMGIASVSSPRGGAREILRDGVNGYLADAPEAWEEKLRRLIRDPERRRAVGAAGRSWIESNYNLEKYGPILVRHLESVAGDPAGGRRQ